MSPEEIEELVRWGYDWFNREKEPPPTWLPDGEFVNSRDDPDHAVYRGIEAIRKQHRGWFEAYPDLRVEPLEIRQRGDRVFAWVHFSGHGADSGIALDMELADHARGRPGSTVRGVLRPRRGVRSRGAAGVGDVAQAGESLLRAPVPIRFEPNAERRENS